MKGVPVFFGDKSKKPEMKTILVDLRSNLVRSQGMPRSRVQKEVHVDSIEPIDETIIMDEDYGNLVQQRISKFKRVRPMQPMSDIDEIYDVISKPFVRLFVDYEKEMRYKSFNLARENRLLGNVNKIRMPGQLERLCDILKDQFYDNLNRFDFQLDADQLFNIIDQKDRFDFARLVLYSETYVLLPRPLRKALVYYLVRVTIHVGRLKAADPLRDFENFNPLAQPQLDTEDLLKMYKSLVRNQDKDIVEREVEIKHRKELESQDRALKQY